MKKYTITEEEWENVISKIRELENESNKLKGYIEGIEKQLYGVVKRTLDQKVVAYDLICKWFAEEYSTDTDRDEVAEMQEQATELNAQIKVLRFIDSTVSTD